MTVRHVRTPEYNWDFNTETGAFARWGDTYKDDPKWSPLGPEILDIEISTICNKHCRFCYKGNSAEGENMSFDTFKQILDKMPSNLTQIAFGIGSIDGNPDLWRIMEYTRERGVVPNVTINGKDFTGEQADNLARLCGAVAVSHYREDECFDAVKKLTDRGMQQVNIHQLLSAETYRKCLRLISLSKSDPRLEKLNAIVFLMLKPKGPRNRMQQLRSRSQYKELIEYAMKERVAIGFDSCSAPAFLNAVDDHPDKKFFQLMAEPCESSLFSSYINTSGRYFHCSFTEGEDGWEGIDVLQAEDFLADVWNHPETIRFRKELWKGEDCTGCRQCHVFDLELTDE